MAPNVYGASGGSRAARRIARCPALDGFPFFEDLLTYWPQIVRGLRDTILLSVTITATDLDPSRAALKANTVAAETVAFLSEREAVRQQKSSTDRQLKSDIAAAILKPFVSEQNLWMVQNHGIFQGHYFFHHVGLDRDLRRRIKRLAALLRLADGFDRGHVGAVSALDVGVEGDADDARLRVTPRAARKGDALRLETWGALRKAGLLAELLKMPIEIAAPDGTVASTADAVDAVAEPA